MGWQIDYKHIDLKKNTHTHSHTLFVQRANALINSDEAKKLKKEEV